MKGAIMKPKNLKTLVLTSWMGTFFGITGCVIGLKAMGMSLWGVLVGILVAAGLAIFVGHHVITELYDDSNESPNP